MDRRDFIGGIGGLVAMSALPAVGASKRATAMSVNYISLPVGAERPFTVFHISDTHLKGLAPTDTEAVHKHLAPRFAGYDPEEALADSIDWAQRHRCDYLLHTGDLIDCATDGNVALLKKFFGSADNILYAPGNHEYATDYAAPRPPQTEAEFREQFRHFLWQWGSIDNYWGQPVTMGGTKADGSTEYNPLSYVILDVMDECALPSPKFHLKIAGNTPDDLLRKALDMARRHRSLSFIGEKPIRRLLEHLGYDSDDARRFVTKGCYEFCTPEAGNGIGGGLANMVKIVELMLADAKAGTFAATDFDAFLAEYRKRLVATIGEVRDFFYVFEQHLDDVNPALVASLAGEYSALVGKDALANGSRTGNRTGQSISGFGTAVDALLAVKELVYERKELSLAELGGIMAKDWEGHEDLRLRMLRSKRKWGNNDAEANALGRELSKTMAPVVNGRPNSRGGKFGLSGHNARQFICEGRLTGATPDGRKKGEEFSKNLSPTMGADTEGMTALVATLASLDSFDFPGDFPLDVMLLPYSVAGDKGLEVMKAIVSQYHENGGFVIQFNVFDVDELKDAQAHPEKYENLQVRVCGWNVRWNDLPKVEQDAYIRRAEEIAR